MKRLLGFGLAALMTAAMLWANQDPAALQVNDYRIGPKDLLEITVYELPEVKQEVRVSEDGSITLTLLGRIEVSGLTAQELEKKLAGLLNRQFTKDAHVTVFIKEYQKVSVIGAVGQPGQYELAGPTTLLQILAKAGGLTSQAMTELFVYRMGADGRQTRTVIRIEDLMIKGDPALNIQLQPKDVITVPVDQTLTVYVYGEVKSPGAIPYMSSRRITLVQAIAQAGGPTEWAKRTRILIKRRDPQTGKEIKLTADLKKIISGKMADIVLEQGDVVIVP